MRRTVIENRTNRKPDPNFRIEARATFGINGQQWGQVNGPYSHQYDYDQFGNMTYRHGWGGEVQGGTAGQDSDKIYTYSNGKNQRDGFTYDAAGNLTNDQVQNYSYDAMGQQATANSSGSLTQNYDGDGLRAAKTENGAMTYYLRSSVLGGQVVAELDGNGGWQRGYVYAGGELMSVQQGGQLYWVHEDSVTKSKRITDVYGNIVSTVELDPYGANTSRSNNSAFLPQSFTTYIRDSNGGQDAMARRYSASSSFAQPDPYGGSYDFGDPQSLNRYAYTKNDPVNFRDPTGTTCVEIWLTPTHYINLCNGNDNPLFDPTFMFGAGSSDGGGGGGIHEGGHGPQNPTTDCQRLADITEQFANEATSVGDFVQRMVNRFIGPNLNVDSRADLERAGNIGTREFGASGFKQQFVDTSNQVRHFTGGLWAGYYYGPGVAQLGMNSREENTITPGTGVIASVAGIFPSLSPTNDSRADVALNSVSSSLGANLTPRAEEIVDRGDRGGWRKIPANPGYKGLAAAIRNKVCE